MRNGIDVEIPGMTGSACETTRIEYGDVAPHPPAEALCEFLTNDDSMPVVLPGGELLDRYFKSRNRIREIGTYREAVKLIPWILVVASEPQPVSNLTHSRDSADLVAIIQRERVKAGIAIEHDQLRGAVRDAGGKTVPR